MTGNQETCTGEGRLGRESREKIRSQFGWSWGLGALRTASVCLSPRWCQAWDLVAGSRMSPLLSLLLGWGFREGNLVPCYSLL